MNHYKATKKEVIPSSFSKGNQIKWLVSDCWIKQDYLGYEALAEVVSSILCSCISNISYIPYDFCSVNYNGVTYKDCCYSENMLMKNEELVLVGKLLEDSNFNMEKLKGMGVVDGIKIVCKTLCNLGVVDLTTYICKTILLDSLILNEDRHLYNIAVIKKSSGKYRLSPIFDNGGALLSDLKDYPLINDNSINMRHVSSKPFSSDFSKQVNGALNIHKEPLIIDYSMLCDKLESFNTDLYSSDIVARCKDVLRFRLKCSEGKTWIKM